jgi:hypothetical protein
MKIKVNKFDFATGKVVSSEREVPDPPSTPLLDALKRKKSGVEKID